MPFHLEHRPVIRPLLMKILCRSPMSDLNDDEELLRDLGLDRLTSRCVVPTHHDAKLRTQAALAYYKDNISQPELDTISSRSSFSAQPELDTSSSRSSFTVQHEFTQHDDKLSAQAALAYYKDNVSQSELDTPSSRSSFSAQHEFTSSNLVTLGFSTLGSSDMLPLTVYAPSITVQAAPKEPKKKSFIDLPGEIKNTIYKYALHYKETRYFDWTGSCHPEHETENLPVSLLRTCKDIHKEAIGFLYDNRRYVVFANIGHEDLEWCMTQFHPFALNRIKDLTILLKIPYKPQAMEQPINLAILNRMKGLECVAYACIVSDGPDMRHNTRIVGKLNRDSLFVKGLAVALLSATPDTVKIYWVNASGIVPGLISSRELKHCQNRYQSLQGDDYIGRAE